MYQGLRVYMDVTESLCAVLCKQPFTFHHWNDGVTPMLCHLDKMRCHISTEETETRLMQTLTCGTLRSYPLESISPRVHQLHAQCLQNQITADCLPFNLKSVGQRHSLAHSGPHQMY